MKGKTTPKHVLDNHSRQLDDTQPEYYLSRGLTREQAEQTAQQVRDASVKPVDPGKPPAK